MSNFLDQFDRFALETWGVDGIVTRSFAAAHPASILARRGVSAVAKKMSIALMTATVGIAAMVPVSASAQTNELWRCNQAMNTFTLADSHSVPPGFWQGAIARMRAMEPVPNNSADFDSLF